MCPGALLCPAGRWLTTAACSLLLLLRACGQAKKHEEEARYVELRERTTKTEETLAQESKRRQEAVRAVQTVCGISASGVGLHPRTATPRDRTLL